MSESWWHAYWTTMTVSSLRFFALRPLSPSLVLLRVVASSASATWRSMKSCDEMSAFFGGMMIYKAAATYPHYSSPSWMRLVFILAAQELTACRSLYPFKRAASLLLLWRRPELRMVSFCSKVVLVHAGSGYHHSRFFFEAGWVATLALVVCSAFHMLYLR